MNNEANVLTCMQLMKDLQGNTVEHVHSTANDSRASLLCETYPLENKVS
jgi:hypothetical protein